MTKLLFVIPTLGNGGAERSFLSLLQSLDRSKYAVDILALRPTGFIADMLPDWVRVLPLPEEYILFKENLFPSVKALLKKGKLRFALNRILYSYTLKKYGYSNIAEQKAYRYLAPLFSFSESYDAAVSYLEKTTNYLVSEKVPATVKIGYIHSDYTKLAVDAAQDRLLMQNLDFLVTISENCKDILQKSLPDFADRIRVIENIIPKAQIRAKAAEKSPYTDPTSIHIATVGRVSYEKGPDIALQTCKILCDRGYDIVWHCIGFVDMPQLRDEADQMGLHDRFILEGLQTNPYKYIYNSRLYVQPSRYEGKSIAIEEAKILYKPIVLTAFSTAASQITDRQTGLIADGIDPASLAHAIETLLDDEALYHTIEHNLRALPCASAQEALESFENLITRKGEVL